MTAVRGKPSGFGIRDKLTSVIMEIIDSQLPQLIDGLGGGTYTPTAHIVIAGAFGLQCSGVLDITGTGVCTIALAATLQINGTCTVGGTGSQTFASGSSLTIASGATLTCTGNATFGGTTTTAGAATFNGTTVCNGAVQLNAGAAVASGQTLQVPVGATLQIQGNSSNSGVMTNTGVIANSGLGRVRKRFITGANSNHMYGGNDADIIRIPAITGDWTWTLTATGSGLGDTMEIYFHGGGSGAHTITLVDDGAFTIGVAMEAGAKNYTKLVFNGTAWDYVCQTSA